jgi:UPF0271 protein
LTAINADIGELEAEVFDGRQEALVAHLTEVNIACGGHAGTEATMRESVAQARRHGCAVGAHPGYPDRANFGRVAMAMELDEVEQTVWEQVRALGAVCEEVRHVKPHGALYNQAAKDRELARAIARGVARYSREVRMVGLAGSAMLEVFAEEGFAVAAEGFADRRYNDDGTLVARGRPDALITDAEEAGRQARRLAESGRVQTICVHGDTAGAVEIARAVARALLL